MFVAKVVGHVWSTIKWPQLEGVKLLTVRPYRLAELQEGIEPTSSELVIAADIFDAGIGDDVIVAYGHAARVALEEQLAANGLPSIPVDAAIVAVVDGFDVDSLALDGSARDGSARDGAR